MKTITITATKTYDILIAPGLIDEAGDHIAKAINGRLAAVVTDDTVNSLYAQRLLTSLQQAGFSAVSFVISHGEASKNADNYIKILNFLAGQGLTRSDAVIALGGGVVGDLAGFAAATYLRGIGFVQVPTTLLAAVDSAVGGKTAIDLAAGKNLAGVFYQPDLVICDVSLLDTLPAPVFRDGMAEVIKYGVIADRELFDLLHTACKSNLTEVIARCVSIKRDIVAIDEFEEGPRKLLNFGHTVGHAVEACSDYLVSHGSAVAIGMVVIARAAVKLGLTAPDTAEAITALIRDTGLPAATDFTAAALARAAYSDKKRRGGMITLVIPSSIGQATLRDVPASELEHIIGLGL